MSLLDKNMTERRQLIPFEHGLETLNQIAGCLNVITISLIQGPLTSKMMVQALQMLQQQHPRLRSRLRGSTTSKLYFEPQEHPIIPFQYLNSDDPEYWREIVLTELNRKIDSDRYLMRATLVSQPPSNRHHLITTLHHAISDGLSTIHLHGAILSHCQALLNSGPPPTITPLPLIPSIETLIPPAYQGPRRHLQSLRFGLGFLLKYLRFRPQTLPFEETVAIPSRRCSFLDYSLPAQVTKQLVTRCRQEKTTVQGVLGAAMLLTVAQQLRGQQQTVAIACSSYTDLRRRLQPPLDNQHLGLFISAIASFHRLTKEVDFWTLARQFKQQINQELANGSPFRALLMGRTLIQGMLLRPHQGSMTIGITNVGQVNLAHIYGPFILEKVSFIPAQTIFGGSFDVAVTTFRDSMELNFMFSQPAMSEATMTVMIKEMIERIAIAITN